MMPCVSGIYMITLRDRIYVGSAINFRSRWRVHKNDLARGSHHSRLMQRTYNKYGSGGLVFEVLEYVENGADLIAREQAWLDKLKPYVGGYNTCPKAGSVFGIKFSAESRARMSATRKGMGAGKIISAEHRAKIAAGLTGGRRSAEQRAAISRAHIGIRQTPESRAKISNTMKGVPKSAETKARMSAAQKKRFSERKAAQT